MKDCIIHCIAMNNKVTDDVLMRFIKDAVDNGVENVIDFNNLIIKLKCDENKSKENGAMNEKIEGTVIQYYPVLRDGVTRFTEMFVKHKNTWSKLPNNVKQHKMRKKRAARYENRDDHLFDIGFDHFDGFGGFGRQGGLFGRYDAHSIDRVNLLNAMLGRSNGRRSEQDSILNQTLVAYYSITVATFK